jgi:predicted AAA+ superfamily ATPase
MEKAQIIEILNTWNFWKKPQKTGIKREKYLKKMEKFSKTGQIISIIGARRSGKSTLILQFIKDIIDRGVASKNTLYVNLEDPRFFGELSLKLLQDIYEAYLEYLKPSEKPYIFLDEVQNILGWEKFARFLQEKEAKVFVSGSTAKLLSSELGQTLTGRYLPIVVYPLSFKEFLYFKGVEIKDELDMIHQKIKIKGLLREYLEFGGFPKVVLSDEKREILIRYFEDIIARDIVERYKIKKVEELRALAKYYITNISSLISFGRIKKFLKLPLHTIERFSYYLSTPYLIFFIKKFAYSLKEQQVNPRKVFCVDTGLRNMISFKFSSDLGKIYENVVFLEFLREEKEIYYWKNKRECDFLLKEEGGNKLFQICFNVDEPEIKEREIRGLLEAMEELKLGKGLVITEDYEGEEKVKGKKIRFIPLWKWLLQ